MGSKFYKSKPVANPSIEEARKQVVRDSNNHLVSFSFKYLAQTSKFNYYENDGAYYGVLIDRLKELSRLTMLEVSANRSSALRAHPIAWEDTTEMCFGIPAEEHLVETPYQLALSANEYGRIHGFFIRHKFFIVWIDKNHLLYR
jgi:hypothetical protein